MGEDFSPLRDFSSKNFCLVKVYPFHFHNCFRLEKTFYELETLFSSLCDFFPKEKTFLDFLCYQLWKSCFRVLCGVFFGTEKIITIVSLDI